MGFHLMMNLQDLVSMSFKKVMGVLVMSSKFDKVVICLFIIFAVISIGACFTPVIDLVKATEVVEASEEQDAKVYNLKWSVGKGGHIELYQLVA